MSVHRLSGENSVECHWFDKGKLREAAFHSAELTSSVPDGSGRGRGLLVIGELADAHVNPAREQFKAIFGLPLDRPVLMLNLLRFKARATYAAGDPEHGEATAVTGAEAYRRYSDAAAPAFAAVGGSQVWIGMPELTLIGPADETWDLAFIARYPTAQAFVDMLRNPDYTRATRHRTAGVADSRLIRCASASPGTTFLPGQT